MLCTATPDISNSSENVNSTTRVYLSVSYNYDNMWKNQFLKVNNSLLELEKDIIELKDSKLKDRESKIEREIKELFFKLIIVTIDGVDKFEQKEMKKIRAIGMIG